MKYSDGTPIKVWDMVKIENRTERYAVVGFNRSTVRLLIIGTAPKPAPSVILPKEFTRDVPAGAITKIGTAHIAVDEDRKA